MATMEEMERRIQQLEARMTEAEDERAIRELLSRYGYTADVKKDKEYVDLYTEDGVMNLGAGSNSAYETLHRWEGKDGLWQFITDTKGHHHPDMYGKRMQDIKSLGIGLGMMIFPMFVPSVVVMWVIAVVCGVGLYFVPR